MAKDTIVDMLRSAREPDLPRSLCDRKVLLQNPWP